MNVLVEHNLLVFLIQLVALLFAAKAAGELFRKLKQPALVGEILVGIIFGPTILGRFLPGVHGWLFPDTALQHSMLETVSWLGVLFLLLVTGFEVETGSLFRHRRPTLSIGVIGVIVPLILGVGLAMLLPDRYLLDPSQRLVFALYMGTAVSISAIPVISKVLHDLNILKSDFGNLAIAAYTVNDILGWVAFTLVLGLATQQSLNWISMLRVFGGTTIFVG
ncbi:sodium:proton antiporter, partial [candidate division WOR-3 bacterium]|nr:sodium:proton antiporter [candidate division WOR-3 bacterium]